MGINDLARGIHETTRSGLEDRFKIRLSTGHEIHANSIVNC